MRRLRVIPTVMNNTVINLYGNYFIGDPTVRLDEIMSVTGVPVWVKRVTLFEDWIKNDTNIWWRFRPFKLM